MPVVQQKVCPVVGQQIVFAPLPQTLAFGQHVPLAHLPPVHAVPLGAFGLEQTPVVGLQVPATWHWSLAVQVTGTGAQVPFPLHVAVQRLPLEPHGVPRAAFVVPTHWPSASHVELVVHGLLSLQVLPTSGEKPQMPAAVQTAFWH